LRFSGTRLLLFSVYTDPIAFYFIHRDAIMFHFGMQGLCANFQPLSSPHTNCQTSDTLSISSLARDTEHIRKSEPNQDGASLYDGRLQFSIGPGYQTHPYSLRSCLLSNGPRESIGIDQFQGSLRIEILGLVPSRGQWSIIGKCALHFG
jgi:hypothetical protein